MSEARRILVVTTIQISPTCHDVNKGTRDISMSRRIAIHRSKTRTKYSSDILETLPAAPAERVPIPGKLVRHRTDGDLVVDCFGD